MKIAIISSGFLPVVDGVTVTLFNRLRLLSQGGHQVLVFCPDYRSLAAIYPDWEIYTGTLFDNVEIINLPSTSFMDLDFERNVSQAAYPVLVEKLNQFQPDVIHVDEPERLFMGFLKVPGVRYAKQHHIPCTGFFHTNFIEYGEDYIPLPSIAKEVTEWAVKRLFAWIYNSYDATLVASSVTYDAVRKMGINNAIYREFLGLDLSLFQPELKRANFFEETYGLSSVDRTIKLIFLGRLTPDKGWNFTLNTLPELAAEVDPNSISILIAGDGSMRQEIITGLQATFPQVHWLGRLAPTAVPALLTNCDIHITTSQKETRGLTVLEALAAGIPALAPRAGGVVDSLPAETGFLFDPSNPLDFLEKLKHLIDNPTLRHTMGQHGKAWVVQFTLERAVNMLLEFWKQKSNQP